ncbi:MAG TPA: site-specific integrase [Thermodesulfobacteriota bacterium]|nr:site-specific integrase [Thermodesulfobacteriota bacterium]
MGLYRRGKIWWMSFTCHGEYYRKSTEITDKKLAERIYGKVKGEIAEGKLPGIYFDKVTLDELAEDFLTDYRINKRDTLDKAKRSAQYLKDFFGEMKAADITTDKVKNYMEHRMSRGLSNASINRELAVLKRMFHLAAECTPPKVTLIPHIPMLKESNVRKGFFEYAEYLAVEDALPGYLKPIATFGYFTGWRISEILSLTWGRVDLKEGKVWLDPGETKNEEGRTFYLTRELIEVMRALHRNRRLDCAHVFHRNGKVIKGFRKAWISACKKAGLKGKIFHDFRRTAIRDMVRSGISEKVAMTISGHKSRNVFERYNIVNDQDLREAALKFQNYQDRKSAAVGTITPKQARVIRFRHGKNG